MPENIYTRYLNLLGISQKEPSLPALEEIIKAQMLKVPFENVSKLYYLKTKGLKTIPDFEQFLFGIEKYHFGGTCYSNNYYLNLLLEFLGYEVRLCGADMSKPDVHVANIVTLDGKEYIVDTGYAAPFLMPLPRSLQQDYVISWGLNEYILKPQDTNGCSRLELYRNGTLLHGYLLKPKSKSIDEFSQSIANSFNPDSTFMNAILLTKFTQDYSIVIHNMNYIEIKNNVTTSKLIKSMNIIIDLINNNFEIPVDILNTALDNLSMNQGAWD